MDERDFLDATGTMNNVSEAIRARVTQIESKLFNLVSILSTWDSELSV